MTEDTLTPEDATDAQAAEYALGLAEGDDLRAAQALVQTDQGFAARVARWQERFVAMTDAIAPVIPNKRVKKALLAQLFPKQKVALLERLWVWKGFTVAALVLAAYVAFPTLRPAPTVEGGAVYATQLQGDSPLAVLAVLDPAAGDIALRRLSGEAPAGRVLELWAILPDQAPVSLGVLPAEDGARVALPVEFAALAAQITLAISEEPPGGAPGGAPTGAVLAVGKLAEL